MRLCQMYNGLISYICSMYEKNPEEETFKTFFLKYHDVLVLYAASILKNVDAAECRVGLFRTGLGKLSL